MSSFDREQFIKEHGFLFNFISCHPNEIRRLKQKYGEKLQQNHYFDLLTDRQLIYYGQLINLGCGTIFITHNNEDASLKDFNSKTQKPISEGHVIIYKLESEPTPRIEIDSLPDRMFCQLLLTELSLENFPREVVDKLDDYFVSSKLGNIRDTDIDQCSLYRTDQNGNRQYIMNPPPGDELYTGFGCKLTPSTDCKDYYSWTCTTTGGSSWCGIRRSVHFNETNRVTYYRYWMFTHCVNEHLTTQLKTLLKETFQFEAPTLRQLLNNHWWKLTERLAYRNACRIHHKVAESYNLSFGAQHEKIDILSYLPDDRIEYPRLLIPSYCHTYNTIVPTHHVQHEENKEKGLSQKISYHVHVFISKNILTKPNDLVPIMTYADGPVNIFSINEYPRVACTIPVCTGKCRNNGNPFPADTKSMFDSSKYIPTHNHSSTIEKRRNIFLFEGDLDSNPRLDSQSYSIYDDGALASLEKNAFFCKKEASCLPVAIRLS